jgi:hypothetical protein
MADTGGMWALIRLLALALATVVVVLALGKGAWLVEPVERIWELVGVGPLPRDPEAVRPDTAASGLVAGLLAATLRPTRRLLGQLATLLHELGHTLVAAALGARPSGIVLRHDASGHATARWLGRPGPARRVSLAVTAFVGLPAPAVAAAAGAGLLQVAGPRPVLWSLAIAGVLVAVLARSAWSLAVAALFLALALAGLSEPAEPWTAAVVVGLLTAVAVHAGLDALRRLWLPIPAGDDARAVRARIGVPARLTQLLQVAVTASASAWCLWLLLPAAWLADLW